MISLEAKPKSQPKTIITQRRRVSRRNAEKLKMYIEYKKGYAQIRLAFQHIFKIFNNNGLIFDEPIIPTFNEFRRAFYLGKSHEYFPEIKDIIVTESDIHILTEFVKELTEIALSCELNIHDLEESL